MSKLILSDGNYHLSLHPERRYIVPRSYFLPAKKEGGILFEKDLVASVRGQLQLINRRDGSILLRSIHNGNYLTLELSDRNNVAFSYEAQKSESVRKSAEFELHSAPAFKVDANLEGACSIYSSDAQCYLNDALTAKETDHSKAAVFILEPSVQFMASIQQELPSTGVYQIRIRGYSGEMDYLVANNEGMLGVSASNSASPGQFRLEYVAGSGAIRLATLDGKYLCPDIVTDNRWLYPDESHQALKFKPINKDESAVHKKYEEAPEEFEISSWTSHGDVTLIHKKYKETPVEFEISTWTSDGVVTLREVRCNNKFMNVEFFDYHLPELVCLTKYEAYQVSESDILCYAHELKFEPVP